MLKTQFEKEVKRAFTLIELIISIIIIGIASMTLPLMLSSANKLEERTLSQDIFFKSITVMTDILSRSWDKVPETNKTVSGSPPEISTEDVKQILIWYVANGDQNLTKKNGLYRYGSVTGEASARRFYSSEDLQDANASDIETTSGEIVAGSTDFEYINKYNNKYIRESTDGANVDYNISVRYVDDKVSTDGTGKRQKAFWTLGESDGYMDKEHSTNLKRINIKATRNFGGEPMEVEFVYFSSNIGTPRIKTKK